MSEIPLIRSYMPELDSVRGIAILLVLFFHGMARPSHAELSFPGRLLFGVSQYGWAGVNLFFVLSGFLITGILLNGKRSPDYFRRFYFRRALRILPALWGILFVLIIGGWISFRFLMVSALFLANLAPMLGVGLQYGPLWSLAVEEHFYMIWPLVVHLSSRRKLLALTTTMFLCSPLLRIFDFYYNHSLPNFSSLYTWFNLDGLSLGALLAIWLHMPFFHRNQLARVAPFVMTASSVAFFVLLRHPLAGTAFVATACNLTSAGFLSCMLLLGTSHWRFLIDQPILKFFGFISYGLYLVHILAFRISEVLLSHPLAALVTRGQPTLAALLRFSGGIILAIGIAYLSRRSLEERFLRMGHNSHAATISYADASVSVDTPISLNS